jgi:hypothetical protein
MTDCPTGEGSRGEIAHALGSGQCMGSGLAVVGQSGAVGALPCLGSLYRDPRGQLGQRRPPGCLVSLEWSVSQTA